MSRPMLHRRGARYLVPAVPEFRTVVERVAGLGPHAATRPANEGACDVTPVVGRARRVDAGQAGETVARERARLAHAHGVERAIAHGAIGHRRRQVAALRRARALRTNGGERTDGIAVDA